MRKFQKLKHLLASLETDADKFYNNIVAAGTGVRKGMQEIKTLAQETRAGVTEIQSKAKSY